MKHHIGPNAAIEIGDSTLEPIESGGDDVMAAIDAYVHRSAGRPAIDAGTGWPQPVQLRFSNGKTTGSVATIPTKLLDGRLVLSKEMLPNIIPMPRSHVGPSSIEFESSNEARIAIEGDGITGDFARPPVYVEDIGP